jgi:ribosomal protein S18 acetylase RimI-like enzyme
LEQIEIGPENPRSRDATDLMEELSARLLAMTGSSGKHSFSTEDAEGSRSVFVVARDPEGKAVGCGALRPLEGGFAEIKRVYARIRSNGVGTRILSYLEEEARKMGYDSIRLETRTVNHCAVAFYERNGYVRIPNYGVYAHRTEAVCFEKSLR